MKEENLIRASDIVGELIKLRQKIKYLEDEQTVIEVGLYHSKMGGDRVTTTQISDTTCAATKVMLLVGIKNRIKQLEEELQTL